MIARRAVLTIIMTLALYGSAGAADLFQAGSWPALASDQRAAKVGDTVTIVVYESSTASNSTSTGGRRTGLFSLGAGSGYSSPQSASLSTQSNFTGQAQTGRSDRLVGQISVTVESLWPNGDFSVSGAQVLTVNNERTTMRVKGRLRPVDISPDNIALSTRLADAVIDYNGAGFVSRSAAPTLVGRLFAWLGLP